MMQFNPSGLSLNGRKKLHQAVREALQEDDEATASGREPENGVRDLRDWAEFRDVLEKAMTEKGEAFSPIRW